MARQCRAILFRLGYNLPMMERDELSAWLRLVETTGVGRTSARTLLAAFGSPEAAIGASTAARQRVVPGPAGAALANPPPGHDALVDRTLRWLEDGAGAGETRDVIVLGDPRYPHLLLETADPPLLLHVRGRIELLQAPSVAVVGSRHPTPQGLDNARAFATHLSRAHWTIVSGLALGVDGAAHQGGLDGPGATVAVVGTGLDVDYPLRHRALAARIAGEGLLVSEYSLGTPGLAPNFPIRNRIIAGLARGTLVVEAALQSGSLITARLASEMGREVFAIPGSIHSPQSRGCHALIRQGAKLVEQGRDILEELGATARGIEPPRPAPPAPPRVASDPLLDALGWEAMAFDELLARTGLPAADLQARLLDLELRGDVARMPGQRFQRQARG